MSPSTGPSSAPLDDTRVAPRSTSPSAPRDPRTPLTETRDDPDVRGDPFGAPPRIERGMSVDRYMILGELGAGGMGVVYAAHDPDLDRRLALKVLHSTDAFVGDFIRASARLVREGQALARLQHPNVVTVFDVGEHAGQVFIAMEFVEGQTLRAWIRARATRRDWAEVLEVFSQAARGLSAAHDEGITHRDFKPKPTGPEARQAPAARPVASATVLRGRSRTRAEAASQRVTPWSCAGFVAR